MKAILYMCGPSGEASRQQMVEILNQLKRDNQYVINAMLNAGMYVPDTVIEAGLNYVPSQHEYDPETGEPVQSYYGMRAMFARGEFSCGDAASYEAAVQEEKYGVPTEVLSVPVGDEDAHGIYVSPDGAVDPVENWLQYWEHMIEWGYAPPTGTAPKASARKPKVRKLGATCTIVEGRVECDVEGDDACCVDLVRKVWRCGDPHLNGKPVEISEVFQGTKTNQKWARTQAGVFVPVCAPQTRRAR